MFKLQVLFYWLKISLRKSFACREDIVAWQDKKLRQFAQKTLKRSEFYKPYFIKGVFDWSRVPIISKVEFMAHFDEINTAGIQLQQAMSVALQGETSRNFKSEIDGITVGLSTGTSGKRGIFLASSKERALWAALVMKKGIKPRLFKKQKIAFFLRANSNLYSSVASALFEFRYFDIFRPIEELCNELNSYQPDIVAAQPSVLIDIAAAIQRRAIHIHPVQAISFAEVLHEDDKQFIKAQLKCNITEAYQCTEGFLGISCEYGTIHINEEFLRIEKEMIDEHHFYPVITDFSRHTQPVVKYRLNDVLVSKVGPCACGSKLMAIERIEGRDDDVLEFGTDNGVVKIYPDLICRRIAIATDSFCKYQITQTGNQHLEIAIATDTTEDTSLKEILLVVFDELFKEKNIYNVTIDFKEHFEITAGSKHRKIKKQFQ